MPADISETSDKQEIRRRMASIRSEISEAEAREAGIKIAGRILELPAVKAILGESPVIALFAPIRREPDLLAGEELFAAHGFRIALPRVEEDTLVFSETGPDTVFVRGSFGIREPSPETRRVLRKDIRVMCLPGLAFDRQGGRIGYGKGYYDRYLAGKGRENLPLLIATGYDFQLLESIPQSVSDRRADYIITPSGTLAANFADSFDTGGRTDG